MKETLRRFITVSVMILAGATTVFAHDLYLLPSAFFVAPGTTVSIRLFNGTFEKSEGSVAVNRVQDLSVVAPAGRTAAPRSGWREKGDTTVFPVRVGETGNYVIGVSTLPRMIRLEAKDFNEYLRTEGSPQILAERRKTGEDKLPARERYAKHVKAILQVGNSQSSNYDAVLGYPVELVPLDNPYALVRGKGLRVRALIDGKPQAGQLLYYAGRRANGTPMPERTVRTDSAGIANLRLPLGGKWYLKFIHMVKVARDTVDYESKWATITFGTK